MPFIQRPAGFNNDTLELLDKAMMGIWLDHVARFNADQIVSGADSNKPRSRRRSLLVYRGRAKPKCH